LGPTLSPRFCFFVILEKIGFDVEYLKLKNCRLFGIAQYSVFIMLFIAVYSIVFDLLLLHH